MHLKERLKLCSYQLKLVVECSHQADILIEIDINELHVRSFL